MSFLHATATQSAMLRTSPSTRTRSGETCSPSASLHYSSSHWQRPAMASRGTSSISQLSSRRRRNVRVASHVHASLAFPADPPNQREFYDESSPLQLLNLKKAKKLAKRILKEKKSLSKIGKMQLVSPDVLEQMTAELDKAYAVVTERAQQLEASGERLCSSSSSSSDDNCGPPSRRAEPDETDASLISDKIEAKRRETAPGFARVCAASVEDAPGISGRVFVCSGKACCRKGGDKVLQKVQAAALSIGGVTVTPTGCLGQCKRGAAVRVKAGVDKPELVTRVSESHVDDIFEYKFDVRPQ